MSDRDTVARQLGREPRPFRVAARCPFGEPSVIENQTALEMPTRFWITCPNLVREISRLESAGGIKAAQEAVGAETISRIHEEHKDRFGTRVAGVREGRNIKCLHAFTALHLAGEIPNKVAEWTLERLERLYPEDRCCSR